MFDNTRKRFDHLLDWLLWRPVRLAIGTHDRFMETPRSRFCWCQLSDNLGRNFGFSIGVSVTAGVVFAVGGVFRVPKVFQFFTFIAIAVVLSWLVPALFVGRRYRRERIKILEENLLDHERSEALRKRLETLFKIPLDDFPTREKVVCDGMYPFRVRYFVSTSMRAGMTGNLKLGLSFSPHMTGKARSISVPNLLDSSSVVFLTDGERTMRVIVPSPTAVKEMLARTLDLQLESVGEGTHTRGVIEGIHPSDEYLVNPVMHPDIIDKLDASCERPIEKRPFVQVRGQVVQQGVAVASSITVGGKHHMFLPTGFLRELAEMISKIIEVQAAVPEVRQAA